MHLLIKKDIIFFKKPTIFTFLVISSFCFGNKALALDNLLPFFFLNKTYANTTALPYTIKDIIYKYISLTTMSKPNINKLNQKKDEVDNLYISHEIKQKKKKIRNKRHKSNIHIKKNIDNEQYKEVQNQDTKNETFIITKGILKNSKNLKKIVPRAQDKNGWFNKKGALFFLIYLCDFLKPAGTWQINRMLCRNATMLEQHNQAILKNYWSLNSSYYGSVTETPSLIQAKFALDYILNKNRYQGKMHYCDIDGQPHEVEISIDYSNQSANICSNYINTQLEIVTDVTLQSITLNPNGTLKHFKATANEHPFDMDANQCQNECNQKEKNTFEIVKNEEVTMKICPVVRDLTTKTVLTCEDSGNQRTNYVSVWTRNDRNIISNFQDDNSFTDVSSDCYSNSSSKIHSTHLTITPSRTGAGSSKMYGDTYSCQLGIHNYHWQKIFNNVLKITVTGLHNPHPDCNTNNMHEVINAPEINYHLIPAATLLATFTLIITATLIYCWKIQTRVLAPGNPMQDADAGIIDGLMQNTSEL